MNFLAFISENLGAIVMLISIFIAFIVSQQFLLAKEKFKLDMFEKRFAVFSSLSLFIADSVNKPKVTSESFQKVNAGTQTASFLFEDDILSLIEEVKAKAREMKFLDDTLEVMEVGATRQKIFIEKEVKKKELMALANNLRNAFSAYLKFKKWKYEILPPDFVQGVMEKMRQ